MEPELRGLLAWRNERPGIQYLARSRATRERERRGPPVVSIYTRDRLARVQSKPPAAWPTLGKMHVSAAPRHLHCRLGSDLVGWESRGSAGLIGQVILRTLPPNPPNPNLQAVRPVSGTFR